jgi:hypothetical protein
LPRGFLTCVAAILTVLPVVQPAWGDALPVLARIAPWPVVSNLIVYKGRIWFVNSVRYPDHNSADVYSYDPRTRNVRFERSLFSQDAGRPAVHRGLLYWPFEDPRASQGWGHVAATDGSAWRIFVIRSREPSFHVHAVAAAGGRLIASGSAWVAGLDMSDDGGPTWRRIFRRSPPGRGIARVLDLAAGGGRTFGAMIEYTGDGPKRSLLAVGGGTVSEIAGWPGGPVASMTVVRGDLYASVDGALWRTTSRGPERVATSATGRNLALLASDGVALFGVVQDGQKGVVVSSDNGRDWSETASFAGGMAVDMAVTGGKVFVGGRGADGMGLLWGPAAVDVAAGTAAAQWPATRVPARVDWNRAGRTLDRALADRAEYENHGRPLRNVVANWIDARPPDDFFSTRLAGPFPDGKVRAFGGAVLAARSDIARWQLLWAMAMSGTGRVPVSLLARRWDEKPNRPRKWFHPTPMALFAVRWRGQNDDRTVQALVDRLAAPGDPDWLRQEVMGTLATLTGQRPGREPSAWRTWWKNAQQGRSRR